MDYYESFLLIILGMKLNINFLSDIIAFQSAVVAIAIPVSLDIISRISEKYNSDVIIAKFNEERPVRALTPCLLINIFIAITLKFVISSDEKNFTFTYIVPLWGTFIIFITTTVLLWKFFRLLRLYSTNTRFLLQVLNNDIEKLFQYTKQKSISSKKSHKNIEAFQDKLNESIEAIGDILTFEAKNKKGNKVIIKELNKIEDIVKELLSTQGDNPIDSLSEENSIILKTIINQFQRINEAAIEAKNLDIINDIFFKLTNLLSFLTQIPKEKVDNSSLIHQVLRQIREIRTSLLKEQYFNDSYFFTIQWYESIIFNSEKINFDIDYLDLLDSYFWDSIQSIINNNQDSIFQKLISTFTNQIAPTQDVEYFWDSIQPNDQDRILETLISKSTDKSTFTNKINLTEDVKYIKTLKDYIRGISDEASREDLINQVDEIYKKSDCLKSMSIQEIKKLLKQIKKYEHIECSIKQKNTYIDLEDLEDLKNKREKFIVFVKYQFKFKNLEIILFWTGAYCLFKEKTNYIKTLWNYNQPPDADAMWINSSVVPFGIDYVINFFFKNEVLYQNLKWDHHHGSSQYLQQYFIFLLLRSIIYTQQQFRQIDVDGTIKQEKSSIIVDVDKNCLNKMNIDLLDRCIQASKEIKENKKLLRYLSFEIDDNNTIEHRLIPIFEVLKTSLKQE